MRGCPCSSYLYHLGTFDFVTMASHFSSWLFFSTLLASVNITWLHFQVTGGAQKKLSSISKVRKNVSRKYFSYFVFTILEFLRIHCQHCIHFPASPQIARVLTVRNEKARKAALAAYSQKKYTTPSLFYWHMMQALHCFVLDVDVLQAHSHWFARQEDSRSPPQAVTQRRTPCAFPLNCVILSFFFILPHVLYFATSCCCLFVPKPCRRLHPHRHCSTCAFHSPPAICPINPSKQAAKVTLREHKKAKHFPARKWADSFNQSLFHCALFWPCIRYAVKA
jgi:hypothetical protein